MFETDPAPVAAAFRARRARCLSLRLVVCCAALAAAPALAGQDYPAGLFENSPVVPHGGQPDAAGPTAPADPSASGPANDGPQDPYASGPADAAPPPYPSGPTNGAPPPYPYPPGPGNFAPAPHPYVAGQAPPPYAYQPPDDYCAGIAFRTFSNLAEVRMAHARCDPYRGGPPPPPGY